MRLQLGPHRRCLPAASELYSRLLLHAPTLPACMRIESNIRTPVSDQAIQEHRLQYAVEQAVRAVVTGRKKSAPTELVRMQRVWTAISSGMANRYDASGTGVCLCFAGLCFARGRADILRAVVEAGQPMWLRDAAGTSQASLFGTSPSSPTSAGPSFLVPTGPSQEEWLTALTRYQLPGSLPSPAMSLFRTAVNPITKHSRDFLALALDVYPVHRDAAAMQGVNPEGAALLTQLQMERHIKAAECGLGQTPHAPGPPAPAKMRPRAGL